MLHNVSSLLAGSSTVPVTQSFSSTPVLQKPRVRWKSEELQRKARLVLHFLIDARLRPRLGTKTAMDGSLGPGSKGSTGKTGQEIRLTNETLILKVLGPVGKRKERSIIRGDSHKALCPCPLCVK